MSWLASNLKACISTTEDCIAELVRTYTYTDGVIHTEALNSLSAISIKPAG